MRKIIFGGILALGGFLTANAQCKTVSTLTENFDTWKDINKCWTAQQGKAMLYASDKKIVFYSMTDPLEKMYLITPKIKKESSMKPVLEELVLMMFWCISAIPIFLLVA